MTDRTVFGGDAGTAKDIAGFAGDVETDIEVRPAPNAPRTPRPRDGAGDERMRRLEERLDQLMRELERQRAENRDRKQDA